MRQSNSFLSLLLIFFLVGCQTTSTVNVRDMPNMLVLPDEGVEVEAPTGLALIGIETNAKQKDYLFPPLLHWIRSGEAGSASTKENSFNLVELGNQDVGTKRYLLFRLPLGEWQLKASLVRHKIQDHFFLYEYGPEATIRASGEPDKILYLGDYVFHSGKMSYGGFAPDLAEQALRQGHPTVHATLIEQRLANDELQAQVIRPEKKMNPIIQPDGDGADWETILSIMMFMS